MREMKPRRDPTRFSDRELDAETRQEIERRAHERYRARGGGDGCDLDDWLAAEQDVRAESVASQAAPAGDKPAGIDRPRRRRRPRA